MVALIFDFSVVEQCYLCLYPGKSIIYTFAHIYTLKKALITNGRIEIKYANVHKVNYEHTHIYIYIYTSTRINLLYILDLY